jgi:predicted ATPase
VVDYLIKQGPSLDVGRIETPRGIVQMIERNLERLGSEDQAVLQAASVAGAGFSSAAIAAAIERPVREIEECCSRLARQEQFVGVAEAAPWPDGTVAASFRFLHALYKDVLYGRVPIGGRAELHRRIGEPEEAAYGERAGEIAAQLANHYREANNLEKAVHFLRPAADQAAARSALSEPEAQLRDAIDSGTRSADLGGARSR